MTVTIKGEKGFDALNQQLLLFWNISFVLNKKESLHKEIVFEGNGSLFSVDASPYKSL